jgi:hypothetical protein
MNIHPHFRAEKKAVGERLRWGGESG